MSLHVEVCVCVRERETGVVIVQEETKAHLMVLQ